jgi:hypothetical protein
MWRTGKEKTETSKTGASRSDQTMHLLAFLWLAKFPVLQTD